MRALRTLLALAVTAGLALTAVVAPPAHASRQSNFITSLVKAAQENQRATGVPASVAIGMAALETGWGRSSMAKEPVNTLFNIKCSKKKSQFQKGCKDFSSYEYRKDGTRYLMVSSFRTYANTGDSIKDFGQFLRSLSRYRKAFDYPNNPDQFVREVRKGGYATDPRYSELVISIMKSHNLYQYDVGGASKPSPQLPVATRDFLPQTYGNVNTNVTTLQRLLNARMGRKIVENGSYGWTTQDAVAYYQADVMKLKEISGDVDAATWKHLAPTLRQGDPGPLVVALQKELQYSGYRDIPIDGVFGEKTKQAVLDFQRRHKLPTTGVVATMTWGRMLGM